MSCIFTYILSFGMGPGQLSSGFFLSVCDLVLTTTLFVSAGVTGVLPTEIFNQAARPAAYMIAGSMMWLNLFLVGMIFPFLVVSA